MAVGGGDELDPVTPWGMLLRALSSSAPPLMDRALFDSLRGLSDQRLAALEKMRAVLEESSIRRPMLIILDDLQWGDPSTLLALGALPLQLFSYPIAWLLARRPLPNSPRLDGLITRLLDSGAERVHLGPLDAADALALAQDLKTRPGADLAAHIAPAEGNPFYIIELLRGRLETRSFEEDRGTVLPTGLRAAVMQSLQSHSDRCRDLLRVASVLGREFTAAEVSAMTGEHASQWISPLQEALTAEVVVESSDRLAFRHDLLRQAVYGELSESMRLALHRDAADALRRTGASTIRVASQLMIGARDGDDAAISLINEAAGELTPTSPGAAADLQLRALDLAGHDDERRAEMILRAVNALALAGRRGEAFAIGGRFLSQHRPPVALEATMQLALREAWVFEHMRGYETALPEHLLHDPTIDPAIVATALACEHGDEMWDGRGGEAERTFKAAFDVVADSQRPLELATVAYLLVLNSTLRGRMEDVLRYAQAALALAKPLEGSQSSGVHEMLLSVALAANGRLGEALSTLRQALSAAEAVGRTYFVVQGQWLRAFYLLAEGEIEDARNEARAEVAAAEELGYSVHRSRGLTVLAETALRQGDGAGARSALARFDPIPEPRSLPDRPWATALAAEARGDVDSFVEAFQPILDQLEAGCFGVSITQHHRLPQLTKMALAAGERHAAETFCDAAATLAEQNPRVGSFASAAAHAGGLLGNDAALLAQAVEQAADSEARLLEAAAREDFATVLARGNLDRQQAVHQLERAFAIYTAASSHRDAARVRAVLRSLGVRKRQASVARPEQGWASLTKSETAVVDLVAEGMTNREAASELFLSPDTVNTHLRHAFIKLGIRSRVALARIAAEHQAATE